MHKKLVLGPILGLESDHHYTVVVVTDQSAGSVNVSYPHHQPVPAQLIGEIDNGKVWRMELNIDSAGEETIDYTLQQDGLTLLDQRGKQRWSFYVPGDKEKPKFAYASCNGFSDLTLMNSTEAPFRLWETMAQEHQREPFSLLLMGGDQIYADAIWTKITALKRWNELDRKDKVKRRATKDMTRQIDRFYSELYVDRWNKEPIASMLASIPSIMMWDDHDIFDGWGSYPEDIQTCDVYQAIFRSARKHFELLQIRGVHNQSLMSANNQPRTHYGAALSFHGYDILVLDNRSERTLSQVMGSAQWQSVTKYLKHNNNQTLLVMSAVPVVYRDFSFAENAVDATPWEEELTDDLKDHWRAKEHEGERSRLIMHLLDSGTRRQGRSVILSGDVHVGALGVIRDLRSADNRAVHQVVSSGIVHPAPSYMQWLGICAITNDRTEYLDENHHIVADMLRPYGSDKYIRARNFATLLEGSDQKLWVNWLTEGKDTPAFPIL
ncbi:alkaline phosphatase D family protein [Vibrio sp. V39_P1S14PM300]|uniref:alkaline phosphatase D family protein n=1 Tax=Vibrio sp. V39_P1S14PM300 TaxID=1938690 RepID=UPI0013736064|nr:alkaline phosphatase D family protein [Vibrio sp. V39_P1S14PM300]NAX20634.1 alkaline phosphatase family protein [Vibrio sp. V39_P1S14PM300]